jgi:hypothetical protein
MATREHAQAKKPAGRAAADERVKTLTEFLRQIEVALADERRRNAARREGRDAERRARSRGWSLADLLTNWMNP